ncbi:MAG: response regulator [Candidatus Heimdallarchaeota archaeon]
MKKILVVDDSGVQRKMIIQIIRKAGFENETLEAEDGNKGIEVLASNFQDVGLVLCDWNMPNMSGLEFIQAVAKVPPVASIPIVMVTTEGTEEKIAEAKAANPNLAGYVPKPFTPEKLKETINPILSASG